MIKILIMSILLISNSLADAKKLNTTKESINKTVGNMPKKMSGFTSKGNLNNFNGGGSNKFSSIIEESTNLEKNIVEVSEKINETIVLDTSITAHRLLIKNNQIFSVTKQKSLLSINLKGNR